MNRFAYIAVSILCVTVMIACERENKNAAPNAAATQPAKSIEISLGTVNSGNGLRTLSGGDGRSAVANIGGSVCRSSKSNRGGHAYLYFAIDPRIKSPRDGGALRNGKVSIEYFDAGAGELRMQYDGSKVHDDGHGAYKIGRPHV